MSEYEIRRLTKTAQSPGAEGEPAPGREIFRHSKKRHEQRTNAALYVVLVVMCVVWLVPFVFLVCQSFRSFQIEGGGMVDYVLPRKGFSMDNYKALFIKDFSAKNYSIADPQNPASVSEAVERLSGDFRRDFTEGFLPWWLITLGLSAAGALVITGAIALVKHEAGRSDSVAAHRWAWLFGILIAAFFGFLLAAGGIRGITYAGAQGVGRLMIAAVLFLASGGVAGYGYLRQDARLLREIPGYPKETVWSLVRQLLALFLELTAMMTVLLCFLQPNANSQYITWYGNTLTIALFVAVIQTVIVLSVSYTLSRIRFKGRKLLMNVVLVLGMFPGFLTMVVLYFLLRDMGLTQSGAVPGLILIYCASSGMGYYISKGFFDTIPKSLDESARIDGATRFQVFLKIIMPLAKPIVIYTILMAFMGPWGDYIFASYVAFGSPNDFNVAVGLYRWVNVNDYQGYFTLFCAGGVLVALPITALFLALQKYYVEGVTGGAVKG